MSSEKTMMSAIRLLITMITAFGLVGCGIVRREISGLETTKEQSTFKQTYSIGPIVENHKDLLLEGPRVLSGTEAGPRVPFVQSQETMSIQVDQDNVTLLMESIRSDIGETLHSSGATVTGSGGFDGRANPITYFSYTYIEGSFYGVVDVWGVRGEGAQFILISQVTESMNSGGN
jgi:hypothetical protein